MTTRGWYRVLWCGAVCAILAAAARSTPAQSDNPGERLMNANCLGCHDIRRIQTQAMDLDGWTKTIVSMVEKGATVSTEDVPVLASYLAAQQGPLPDGAGKAIVLNTCTLCHDLRRIRRGRRSPEEWEETLNAMLNEGAPLSDDGFPVVHAYLSRHFGVE
jgi:cytochrome c5